MCDVVWVWVYVRDTSEVLDALRPRILTQKGSIPQKLVLSLFKLIVTVGTT